MRRAEVGIFHRTSGKYLDWYAAAIAWREDMRRTDFRKQGKSMLASAMKHSVSANMCGYWQRGDKAKEVLVGWHLLSGLV